MPPDASRTALPALLAAAIIALAIWERRADTRLQAELASLRSKQSELIRLRDYNQQLASATENLSAAIARRKQTAQAPRRLIAPLPPGFIATGELANAGRSTPHDAFETYLWAIDTDDRTALAQTLAISDAGRAKIEALFSQLPPADQARYGTAQAMFALLYAYANPVYLSGLEIMGEARSEPNQVALGMKWQFPAGQIRDHSVMLYQSSDGWKVSVSDGQVASVLQKTPSQAP